MKVHAISANFSNSERYLAALGAVNGLAPAAQVINIHLVARLSRRRAAW
jgi:hypothetical protein